MFSLQTIFGKGDRFYGLLEASAEAALLSTQALIAMLDENIETPPLDEFRLARRREKELFAEINRELVDTFVTALEREDIEALAGALYRIPKTVEKFADRYVMFPDRVAGRDFASRARMLESAMDVIVQMVSELRKGFKLDVMHELNERMQAIESEADRLLMVLYHDLFTNEDDIRTLLLHRDLFELLEKAIDRCRDAGNIIYHIVLKHS